MAGPQPKERGIRPASEGPSVAEVIRELGTSVKDLVESEFNLARTEMMESASFVGKHSAKAAVFGAILAISVFPFLAFCIIGLGNLLGGMYWLSSLIVTAVCALIGGPMAYSAYSKIASADLTLSHTRKAFERQKESVVDKTQEVKEMTANKVRDIRDATQRRRS